MASPKLLHRTLRLTIRRRIPTCTRNYHSYEHEPPPPFTPTENAILSAALSHVPSHGFTNTALVHGARDAGYLDVSVNLFPAGAFALVNHHLVTQRLALAQHAPSIEEQQPLNIAANVRNLTLRRLHGNKPIIHRWQEALALLALPPNIPSSLRELAALSDEILFLAGDVSVDTSWYTKRASLSAIYAAAELFMTQDTSTDFAETETFLERRLEGARKTHEVLGGVGRWVGYQGMGVLNGLRSKGVRI